MHSFQTVALILTPMFIGFLIRLPRPYLPILDKILNALVYLILLFIGLGLAQVGNLSTQMGNIAIYTFSLFTLLMLCNLIALLGFEKYSPWTKQNTQKHHNQISITSSLKQLATVGIGIISGSLLPERFHPPEQTGTLALMLLVFIVGMQLRSNGIALHTILLHRRGIQVSIVFMLSCMVAGLLLSLIFPEISWQKGLALANGYGWYSLSGMMITHAYGAQWGSVALLNDLLREFFALVLIPILMQRSASTAVGIGGATSLDFTLPLIQNSGGLNVVPLAISFGFIVNLTAPLFMAIFSAT